MLCGHTIEMGRILLISKSPDFETDSLYKFLLIDYHRKRTVGCQDNCTQMPPRLHRLQIHDPQMYFMMVQISDSFRVNSSKYKQSVAKLFREFLLIFHEIKLPSRSRVGVGHYHKGWWRSRSEMRVFSATRSSIPFSREFFSLAIFLC